MIEDLIARYLVIVLNGLFSASTLFLLGTGLSLIFGILNFLNLSHAAFLTLGAFVGSSVIQAIAGSLNVGSTALFLIFLLALVVVVPVIVSLVGLGLEVTIFRRLYDVDVTYQLLATFGLILMLEDTMRFIWGGQPISATAPSNLLGNASILGRTYPLWPLLATAITAVIAAGLYYFFEETRLGKIARAMAEDPEIVRTTGIDTRAIHLRIFVLGVALAGLGGALLLPNASVTTGASIQYVILAFAVLVIGGLGSLKGAIVASILIAMIESFLTVFVPEIALAVVFVLMAAIMLVKPTGFYGGVAYGQ